MSCQTALSLIISAGLLATSHIRFEIAVRERNSVSWMRTKALFTYIVEIRKNAESNPQKRTFSGLNPVDTLPIGGTPETAERYRDLTSEKSLLAKTAIERKVKRTLRLNILLFLIFLYGTIFLIDFLYDTYPNLF
ncbi:MAG: hypothetical protein AAF950_07135 [Pseudomonadota bacterium]